MRQTLHTAPKRYQIQAVRKLEANNGRCILGDDMGLGKTYEALAWIALHPDIRRVVIVCPSSIKYQWKQQARHHAGLRAQVLEGVTPYTPSHNIVIINYSILAHAEWPGGRGRGARPKFPWVERLLQQGPQAVILDEFHYIKNTRALRTKACIQLCRKVPHLISCSGTPIEKSPVEFYPILNLTAPTDFPSFWQYAFQYCDPKRGWRGRGWDFSGASNLEELHQKVQPWMIRRMKCEVAKELPPKIRSVIPVPITNPQEYHHAEEDFLDWAEAHLGKAAAKRASNAIALTRLGKLKQIAAQGKLQALNAWIKDFLDTDGKLIVFGVHHSILNSLHQMFPLAATVSGKVPPKHRPAQVARFIQNPKCRIFLGQIKAAGIGLDGLHQAASSVLFAELAWNPSDHEQAEDRALRIGQHASSVNVYYMVGKHTIEEDLLNILQHKHHVCKQVLDGQALYEDLFTTQHQRRNGNGSKA